MSEELKLFTKCPECNGTGRKQRNRGWDKCKACNYDGYIPWEPKAAPLVWKDGELSSSSSITFVFYHVRG